MFEPKLRVAYTMGNNGATSSLEYDFDFGENVEDWQYSCTNVYEKVQSAQSGGGNFKMESLKIFSQNQDTNTFIDEIKISSIVTDTEDLLSERQAPPGNKLLEDVKVNKTSNATSSSFEVTLIPHNCANNFDLFSVLGGQIQSQRIENEWEEVVYAVQNGSLTTIQRIETASPAVTGTFSLSWDDIIWTESDANISGKDLQLKLRALKKLGNVNVERSGTCAGYNWTIDWTDIGGDQPLPNVNGNLTGINASIHVASLQEGKKVYTTWPSNLISTLHSSSEPQVTLKIDGISSMCNGSCGFNWTVDNTPVVSGITPSNGTFGERVIVTGSNLDEIEGTNQNSSLMIGNSQCEIIRQTATEIECELGYGEIGTHGVHINVAGRGNATCSETFNYKGNVDTVHPLEGSLAGVPVMTVYGNGFGDTTTVTVDGIECPRLSVNFTHFSCQVPAFSGGNETTSVPIALTFTSDESKKRRKRSTNSQIIASFVYSTALTPVVVSVSGFNASVTGNETLVIHGTNLLALGNRTGNDTGDIKVSLCGTNAVVQQASDYEITVKIPPNPPASCPIILDVKYAGFGDISTNNISHINYVLHVSDVYPASGSVLGGTKLTIIGRGFTSPNIEDYTVSFGEDNSKDCYVTRVSEHEIVCETDSSATSYLISNTGSHPDRGYGHAWNETVIIIHPGDEVKFTWFNDIIGLMGGLCQVISATNRTALPGGFGTSQTSARGSFSHKFNVSGTYYFSSCTDIEFGGTIFVTESPSKTKNLNLKMFEFEAQHINVQGNSVTPSEESCLCSTSSIPSCQPGETIDSSSNKSHSFNYSPCHTPKVSSIQPNRLHTSDVITISGSGFGDNVCENEVYFGEYTCIVHLSNDTTILCHMDPSEQPEIHSALPLSLRVCNRGNSLVQSQERYIVIEPYFDVFTPTHGSTEGGTTVTISGNGFTANNVAYISLNDVTCDISTVEYSEIVCISGKRIASEGVVSVGPGIPCIADNCNFIYSSDSTTVVISISPLSISGASNNISITGGFESTNGNNISIFIGDEVCDVISMSDTNIICNVNNVEAGEHAMTIITLFGFASVPSSSSLITVNGSIHSFSPSSGSIMGGTMLTILGSNFGEYPIVQVGTSDCELTSVDFDKIECKTGSVPGSGQGEVRVSTITAQGMFEYSDSHTPTIESMNPNAASGATTLTISGTGFSAIAQDNVVTVGTEQCNVTSASANEIQCDISAKQAGEYLVNLSVVNNGTAFGTLTYTSITDLNATTVSPVTGSYGGEQVLTFTGLSATPGANTRITICGNECEVISSSASEIECITPSNENENSSTVDCSVVVEVGNAAVTLNYAYDASLTPDISGITPQSFGSGGGSTVTITGSNFNDPTELTVSIADNECDIEQSSSNSTQLVCVTRQSNITGTHDVIVKRHGKGKNRPHPNGKVTIQDPWSSRATWRGKEPPVQGEFVVIPIGQLILLDEDTPTLKFLLIDGGTLVFSDELDIHLRAEYILVTNGGVLQVGTEENPYQHNAVITLYGHQQSTELPVYGAKVLAVRSGTLDLHGKPTIHTWTHLAETATAGATTVTLKQAVDWPTGSEIVIATTGHKHSQRESETRTIRDVSEDGYTLTFNEPLDYVHLGIEETFIDDNSDRSNKFEMRAEVGLLSHNVKFEGSKDSQWHDQIEACEEGFDTGEFVTQTCFQGRFGGETGSDEFGGHLFMHEPNKTDKESTIARISGTEFYHVGQAFRLARYPIHFHLLGDAESSYVRGCSIHKTYNRAVNIHASHGVLVEYNVVYDVMGGAFFLEDGIETGNIIQYNLAVFVKSSTSLLNDDITPAAFWITNPNNTIEHNAAAGGTHFGYWYRLHDNPDGPSFDANIFPKKAPLGSFKNNSAHSLGWFGLWIFQEYYPTVSGEGSESAPANFTGFNSWRCEKCAEFVDVGNIQFIDFVCIEHEKGAVEFKSIENSKNGAMIADGFIVRKTSVYGDNSCISTAIVVPFFSGLLVRNVTFINYDCGGSKVFAGAVFDGRCVDLCGSSQLQTELLHFWNSPNKVAFRWAYEFVIIDLDGSLTGIVNAKVVAWVDCYDNNCDRNVDGVKAGSHPGAVCPPSTSFLTFGIQHIAPASLNYKNIKFINEYGTCVVEFRTKRIHFKEGWMVVLLASLVHKMILGNAEQITNISYSAGIYDLPENTAEFFMVTTNVSSDFRPDCTNIFAADECRQAVTVPQSTAQILDSGEDVVVNWNQETQENTIFISNGNGREEKRLSVQLFECYYENCEVPDTTSELNIPERRPDDALYWSNHATWGVLNDMGVPKPLADGSLNDLTIPNGVWLVLDERIDDVILGTLNIEGVLEFEQGLDLLLNAHCILVLGGSFLIGWPDNPYSGTAVVKLHGNHQSEYCAYPEGGVGPPMGTNAIGVFGYMAFHGLDIGTAWTRLAVTAEAGSDTITLEEDVGWGIGAEIVITTTSYKVSETEKRDIKRISGNQITLNEALQFQHKAADRITALVGILKRNVKITGAVYDTIDEETTSARVLVGTMARGDTVIAGAATLNNTEFVNCGQNGFSDSYDPRFCLAFLNAEGSSISSKVSKCSFHNAPAPAVGVFGTGLVLMNDNVLYNVVGSGFRIGEGSPETKLLRNLVSQVLSECCHRGRNEASNIEWDSGIDLRFAKHFYTDGSSMDGNVVVSERAGFSVPGEHYSTGCPSRGNNIAFATLTGVLILPDWDLEAEVLCVSGFTVINAIDYGIYVQSEASIEIHNVVIVNAGVGIFTMVVGPGILTHIKANKYTRTDNATLIGYSDDFDCNVDVIPHDTNNYKNTAQSRYPGGGKHSGSVLTSFVSAPNGAPFKPWPNLMSYPALGGGTQISNSSYSGFSHSCNGETLSGIAISTNPNNDDATHPTTLIGNIFDIPPGADSAKPSKYKIHRPRIGSINPSDCVDMDCDGQKKVILKELNQGSTIISDSGFEWGGDPRRGLGDYRIPKTMLTDPDGTRRNVIDIAPNKGIIRDDSCEFIPPWQAYKCTSTINYIMMIIESMDHDTEDRRLSPVAILSDNKYIDLINGPQDHGWCNGYTCQQRVSTFFSVVATGHSYKIYFTSTNPQRLRIYFLNASPEDSVVLAVYYASSNKKDIFANNHLVRPNNYVEGGTLAEFQNSSIPQMGAPAGSNCFDPTAKFLHMALTGESTVEIVESALVVVAFNVPAMSLDEFFGPNLVNNLANFLGIPASKIRISIREPSPRRKRVAETTVVLEISEETVTVLNDNGAGIDDARRELTNISNTLVTLTQLGTIGEQLNITVLSVSITEPLPPSSDPAWEVVAEDIAENNGLVSQPVPIPEVMEVLSWDETGVESVGFATTLSLHVFDSEQNHVSLLGSTASPWEVTAILANGTDPDATLFGNATIPFKKGYANFTDLSISHTGSGFMITIIVTLPAEAAFLRTVVGPFTITARTLSGRSASTMVTSVAKNNNFEAIVEVIDQMTSEKARNISWRGHEWECTISLNNGTNYPGSLTTVDSYMASINNESLATFTGMRLSHVGKVSFTYNCVTTPESDYSFQVASSMITVTYAESDMPGTDISKSVVIKFDLNFDTIFGQEDDFIAVVHNRLSHDYTDVLFDGYILARGSIETSFIMNGTEHTVNTAIDNLWQALQDGMTIIYDGQTVDAMPYMSVDGRDKKNVEEAETKGLGIGVIIAIVLCVLAVFVLVLIIVLVFICCKPDKKIEDTEGAFTKPDETSRMSDSKGTVVTNTSTLNLIDNAKTVSTLDTPMNRSSSSLSNSSGKCSVETHPFSLQEEDVTKFQNAGILVKGSRPGSKNEFYDEEKEQKKTLENFNVVLGHVSKGSSNSMTEPDM